MEDRKIDKNALTEVYVILNQLEFNYEEFNSRYHRIGNGNDIFIIILF